MIRTCRSQSRFQEQEEQARIAQYAVHFSGRRSTLSARSGNSVNPTDADIVSTQELIAQSGIDRRLDHAVPDCVLPVEPFSEKGDTLTDCRRTCRIRT